MCQCELLFLVTMLDPPHTLTVLISLYVSPLVDPHFDDEGTIILAKIFGIQLFFRNGGRET